jgi:hypothetical protein
MFTLLGSLLGFSTSIFPSILEYFQDKKDKKYELDSIELQMKLMDKQSECSTQELKLKEDIRRMELELEVEKESVIGAHKSQPVIGIKFIDGLRGSVRPIITYWFMGLYTFSKVSLMLSINESNWLLLSQKLFSDEDIAMLATILAFWFGDRLCANHKKKNLKK